MTSRIKNTFNPENLNMAVLLISRKNSVSEYMIRDRLNDVSVFGFDKAACSVGQILNLWDDYCANDFASDCEEIGLAA